MRPLKIIKCASGGYKVEFMDVSNLINYKTGKPFKRFIVYSCIIMPNDEPFEWVQGLFLDRKNVH